MPFQPVEEDDPFTVDDWLEAVELSAPSDTYSNDNAEAVLPVYIENATEGKLRSALTFVLGYSYADAGTPYKLHRVNPVEHPIWGYQMRASSVQFTRFNPVGNPENTPDNEPHRTSQITGAAGVIQRYASYGQCWMTVRFNQRPYFLYEDDEPEFIALGSELYRYVERTEEPSLEVLMSDSGGVMFWAETNTDGPTVGSHFPGQIGELIQKKTINLLWREVAMSFTHDSDGNPTKIESCVGRVNSTEFLGYPAGTLLFQPPKFDKRMYPFYSDDGRAFYHNILIQLSHFDPPPGAASPLARGHQLFPWRGGSSESGSAGSGPGWYTAYRGDGTSGKKYLRETDFAAAFQHVNKP